MGLFWDKENIQSLCQLCHSSDKARMENATRPKGKKPVKPFLYDERGFPTWWQEEVDEH